MALGQNIFGVKPPAQQQAQPAAPKPLGFGGQPPNYSYGGYNLSPDHWGVVQEGISLGQDKNPYWNQWLADLTGNKLQGSPTYFSQNYNQQAAGNAALAKVQESEQAKINGQFGDIKGGLQEQYAQRGLGRSGLFAEGLSRLAGAESGELDSLKARIDADKQKFTQGLQEQWAAERQIERERNQRKRDRKYGVASQLLSTAGMIGGFALAGPAGGYAGSQLGTGM